MERLLVTICARGGSKGIPGKNTKLLKGKPLIQYSFEVAEKLKNYFDVTIQLSTEDNNIIQSVEKLGYSTSYLRPKELATDNAKKLDVIRHAHQYAKTFFKTEFDYVLDLDVSSPLRNLTDILNAFKKIKKHSKALNIFSVNNANRNPYFNQVEEESNGFVKKVKHVDNITGRQSAPKVYDMNASFYIYTNNYMRGDYNRAVTDQSIIYVMDHICFDLDEPMDFVIMELLLEHNKLDFEL